MDPQESSPRVRPLPTSPDVFDTIAATLWRERESLETLLFKLVEQQLILTSGNTRWLHLVDDEVRAAAAELREAELIRAAELGLLARQRGLELETTLRELVAVAPEPWPIVFEEHGNALRSLAREIQSVSDENTRLLHAGEQAIHEILEHLDREPASRDTSATW
jgi:FlgN protein